MRLSPIVPLGRLDPPPPPSTRPPPPLLSPAIVNGSGPTSAPTVRVNPIVPLTRLQPTAPIPVPGLLSPMIGVRAAVSPSALNPVALRVALQYALRVVFPVIGQHTFAHPPAGFQVRVPLMLDPAGRYMRALIARRAVFDRYLSYRCYYYVSYGSVIASTSLPGSPTVPLVGGYESGIAVETFEHPMPGEHGRLVFYPGHGKREAYPV